MLPDTFVPSFFVGPNSTQPEDGPLTPQRIVMPFSVGSETMGGPAWELEGALSCAMDRCGAKAESPEKAAALVRKFRRFIGRELWNQNNYGSGYPDVAENGESDVGSPLCAGLESIPSCYDA